jgi:hypothetical protein
MRNNITCSTNCQYRTATTLYIPTNMVCLWCIIVNTLHNGVNKYTNDSVTLKIKIPSILYSAMFCESDLFIHSHLWNYLLPEVCLIYRTFRDLVLSPSIFVNISSNLYHTLSSDISNKVGIKGGTPRTVSLSDWSLWSYSCYKSFFSECLRIHNMDGTSNNSSNIISSILHYN